MMLVQHRLGIQQIHGAGAAVHEQQDDRLGLGLEVGFSGSDIIDTAAGRDRGEPDLSAGLDTPNRSRVSMWAKATP